MNPVAIMETSAGRIEIELWPERAPKHVANFEKLVGQKFYENLVFHRVIPNFMIQTGCPNGNGMGGPGWKVDAEFNKTPFTRGVLGMARSAHPNSAGSQFFVCVADASHLNGSYTAFGKVTSGMEFCDAIAKQERDRRDRPLVDVKLVSVTMPGLADAEKKVKAALEAAAVAAAPVVAAPVTPMRTTPEVKPAAMTETKPKMVEATKVVAKPNAVVKPKAVAKPAAKAPAKAVAKPKAVATPKAAVKAKAKPAAKAPSKAKAKLATKAKPKAVANPKAKLASKGKK